MPVSPQGEKKEKERIFDFVLEKLKKTNVYTILSDNLKKRGKKIRL